MKSGARLRLNKKSAIVSWSLDFAKSKRVYSIGGDPVNRGARIEGNRLLNWAIKRTTQEENQKITTEEN